MGKRWDESFIEAFNAGGNPFVRGMQMAQQKKRMNQYQELAQARQDESLGKKGFARMDDDEAKEYLIKLNKKGVPVIGSGYAGLPEGASLEDGYIYDKSKQVIGEYSAGNEPKPIKNYLDQYPDGTFRVGSNFYRYNTDLAKKMGVKTAPEDISLDEIKKTLAGQGFQGGVTPYMIKTPNQTYIYRPTLEEKGGLMQQPISQQPLPIQSQLNNQPVTAPTFAQGKRTPQDIEKYRGAVSNAIKSGAKPEDILSGLSEGGFDPKDFEDLLYGYTPSVSPLRRQILGGVLKNVGISAPMASKYLTSFSNTIDKIKNRSK